MPLVISGLNEAFDKLQNRVIQGARAGMEASGKIVIEAIQANFDASGDRGGHEEWEPVPLSWIVRRETWPRGASKAAQEAYADSAKPLIDTGALRNSYKFSMVETPDGNIEAGVQSTLDYDEDHEKGVPGEIWPRPHMWITDEDEREAQDATIYAMEQALR